MKIDGGFLDGHVLHFSRNLNCIIGGRGAGKSTAFEVARSLSPLPSTSGIIDSEAWPVSLHVVWVDQAGQQHIIRRRINEEPQNLTDPVTGPLVFPLESYGQSETAQTSARAQQDPEVLLEYLDKFTGARELLTEEDEIRNQLLNNQTEVEKATAQVARIPEFKRLLAHTEQQLKTLESANAKEIVVLERRIGALSHHCLVTTFQWSILAHAQGDDLLPEWWSQHRSHYLRLAFGATCVGRTQRSAQAPIGRCADRNTITS